MHSVIYVKSKFNCKNIINQMYFIIIIIMAKFVFK